MKGFPAGNDSWKLRKTNRARRMKDNGIKVLRPIDEIRYWRKMLDMAVEGKDHKALMQALEIISVIQRGKPATQQPVKSREKTDQLSSLMSEVFRAKPAGKNTVTQSNQSDTDE